MRLTIIWTMPGMSFTERLLRTRDNLALSIAIRLPKRIRYWSTMNDIGYATMHSSNVPATPVSELIKNLRTPVVVR